MTKFARLTLLVVLLAQLFVPGRSTAIDTADSEFLAPAGLIDSTLHAPATVSLDSLERPAITYHNQRVLSTPPTP